MNYYEVLVGDMHYHGSSALTYAHEDRLPVGAVVRIALRSRSVLGIVAAQVAKPTFAIKPIAAAWTKGCLPTESLQLINWLAAYYPAPFGAIVRLFLPPTTSFPGEKTKAQAVRPQQPTTPPPLTPAQRQALEHIEPSGYHLLHGITGSGKTRIYLEIAAKTLAANKSVILLTPEIGLTAQLVQSVSNSLNHTVYVIHSRQTQAERRNIWYAIMAEEKPVIVIGPRSALFAPLHNLGLIVIDESHDQAYKNEGAPQFRTERVAAKLAALHNACLISGSATPTVDEYYVASAKNRPIITLTTLAKTQQASTHDANVTLVDIRDRSAFTASPHLSDLVIQQLRDTLSRQEQSLLFLNRRGTAAAILCAQCGWQAACTHCDLPLTYHADNHKTRCHVCGRAWPLPVNCPDCGNSDVLLKTIGTKALEQEVQRLFPEARIHRFDSDTEKSEHLDQQLEALQKGTVDIIVGTQMVTKGLDLPKLSFVGVLNADSSLLIPDYTANERTYQMLTQVIGRTGRGHTDGAVIIQTYNPNQPVIRAAAAQDWQAFYAQEIREREQFRFPPFVFMLKLTCIRASNSAAEKAANNLRDTLNSQRLHIEVDGPSPAFHPKENGKYKWQLIVKCSSRQVLVHIIDTLPSGWRHDIDPINLL